MRTRRPLSDGIPSYVTRGRRRIDGRYWVQANSRPTKPAARAQAKRWRSAGRKARVIKVGKGWSVFVGGSRRR